MLDPIEDVKNLALLAAIDAEQAPEQVFEPRNHYYPKATNIGAGLMIKPEYFVVSGYIGADKKTEFYSVKDFGPDSARFNFQQKYLAAGVRSVEVKPLYDLGRYA